MHLINLDSTWQEESFKKLSYRKYQRISHLLLISLRIVKNFSSFKPEMLAQVITVQLFKIKFYPKKIIITNIKNIWDTNNVRPAWIDL